MKRILALILATLMFTCLFAGCGSEDETDGNVDEIGSELWSVQEKGKLTIGMRTYKPMNYKDDEGNLTGFETAFAKLVCKELGVDADFVEIIWDTKEINLTAESAIGGDSGAVLDSTDIRIDCIWNGMAITDARAAKMSFSKPYLKDSQVLVVKASDVANYQEKMQNPEILKTFYTESGSVASEVVKEEKKFFNKALPSDEETMYLALNAVRDTAAEDFSMAVVSKSMALANVGEGKEFADLAIVPGVEFRPVEIAIAFRQNSDLKTAVDAVIDNLMKPADGESISAFEKLVKKYGLESMMLPQA